MDIKKIKNILVVVDGNENMQSFLAAVTAVAKNSGAQVTLLSVLDSPSESQQKSVESSDLQKWMMEDHLKRMQTISSELEKNEIQVSVKQSIGKPYLEIIREALKGKYDLIMKPAASETNLKDILFGSTDMKLFRKCPYPLWVYKPTVTIKSRRIMVAVDLLEYDQEKSALADTVLQWANNVSSLVGSELHVVHVWDLYGEMTLRGRSVLAYTVDKIVKNEERKHRQWLNNALQKNRIEKKNIQIHFCKGEAKKLIPEIVNATRTDLLVMGTVGRTGIPGFFIGNTADTVLRQVDCSVLAVKPEGFLSPVA